MKKTTLIILILLYLTTFSQENTAHQWHFSTNAGVNFSTGIPIAITNSPLVTSEGCATIGDINGNLLFYTDGQKVYNRNDQLMPNGTGLMGNSSASQSSIIVPYPGSDSLFYIFTVDAIENHLANGLRYSIVDMSLDGGLGDIIDTVKNILLETPVSEKLTAVLHSDNISIWLIAHKWDSDEFITYKISSTGINTTPIISAIGSVHEGGYSSGSVEDGWTNAIGLMKANMQGTKIALAIYRMNKIELFDFDKSSGILSNFKESPDIYTDVYGVEFSPDGNYLYSTQTTSKLYQFKINQTNPFDNPYLISSGGYQHRGIQIGPNGKIYISRLYNTYLSAINHPNNAGSNVDFENEAVYLEGKECSTGLPTLFYYKGFKFFTGSEVDTSICQGDSIFLENNFQTLEGTYYDTVLTSLGWDSIINTNLTILTTPATPSITETSGILTSSTALNYQWYFNGNLVVGATDQQYQPLTSGNYSVAVNNGNGCLSFSDEFNFIYTRINNNTQNNRINIFPNPTSNILNINLPESAYLLTITDITGQIIKTITNDKKEYKIDLSNYPKGLYFIDIKTKTYSTIKKVIIK